jgi:formylglycine-generating enzyme required for sulfatase activity
MVGGWPTLPGYEILGELGRGAMGVVYKALQLRLNRVVALKMLLAGAHAGAAELLRFVAEAEAIARLSHPHIVPVYETGQCRGLPWFTLEFMRGGSLAERLAGRPQQRLDAARLIEHLARAVHHAHEQGIVHRDLKPGNVLLLEPEKTPLGQCTPKISDFGLAKRVWLGEGLTATRQLLGTPCYMAPEQALDSKHIGAAADVYALGAILYEMLTGRPPFKAPTAMETVVLVVHDEPVAPSRLQPRISRDLETICCKCLHKQPERRYASAADLADDLARFLDGRPIVARPAGRLERLVKWVKRRIVPPGRESALVALAGERRARTERARAQVQTLLSAKPGDVAPILEALATEQDEVLVRLHEVWNEKEDGARPRRMRAGLALLAVAPQRVRDELAAWMLQVDDPAEMLLIRQTLLPHAEPLRPFLWRRAQTDPAPPEERLRALAALAALAPDGDGWRQVDGQALAPWLSADPLFLGQWTSALRPVRRVLVGPLTEVFRGRQMAGKRQVAASILGDYVSDQPEVLAGLIADADDDQFSLLFPRLLVDAARVSEELLRELKAPAGPSWTEHGETQARRQAGAGAALLKLGCPRDVWPLLRHRSDPEVRSRLIQQLGPAGVGARILVERLAAEAEVSVRRALILALGEYSAEQLPAELRSDLVPRLLDWYRRDPDAGVHGAIDWLLRHNQEGPLRRKLDWGTADVLRGIDEELAAQGCTTVRQGGCVQASRLPAKTIGQGGGWYVNSQGQTLALVDARQPFFMGSPDEERGHESDEKLHSRRIGRCFALGTKPVTVAGFQRFLQASPGIQTRSPGPFKWEQYSTEADSPITSVGWYEAAQYCRWLSEQEGVAEDEMCYPAVATIEDHKKNGTPLELPPDYLRRSGYRLPTEAEWEFACRAGARTSRCYGSSVELLARYAWYFDNARNRTWPVGQKRPNDLGLFDMHGHVWNWCQEGYAAYPPGSLDQPAQDEEDQSLVSGQSIRLLRGAAFRYLPNDVRSAYRFPTRLADRTNTVGIRVARTWDALVEDD